ELAGLTCDRFHDAVMRRTHRKLHLHCFEDDDCFTSGNGLTGLDQHGSHRRRHRRRQRSRLVTTLASGASGACSKTIKNALRLTPRVFASASGPYANRPAIGGDAPLAVTELVQREYRVT